MTIQFSASDTMRDTIQFSPNDVAVQPSKARSASIYQTYAKQGLDLFCTILAAPIVLPVVAMLALLIALDGRNPFYSQTRIGKNGKSFRIWKLRTMVHDADALLASFLAADPKAKAEWDSTQKLKKDPRITKIGKLLRKTSLDELPQLWNVVNGSMAIVGPRPMMLSQRQYYSGTAYYNLRPGITGLWQVTDRNESCFQDRIHYDETYAQKISLKTDLTVLAQTVGVVLRGTGY